MAFLDEVEDLFEGDAVEVSTGLGRVGFAFDAEKVLFERDWAEGGVEVEEAMMSGYPGWMSVTEQGAWERDKTLGNPRHLCN